MPTPFIQSRRLIWRGDVAVENGEFVASYVVPKRYFIFQMNQAEFLLTLILLRRIRIYAAVLVGGTSDSPRMTMGPGDFPVPERDNFFVDGESFRPIQSSLQNFLMRAAIQSVRESAT
jgi:hypothetical protein